MGPGPLLQLLWGMAGQGLFLASPSSPDLGRWNSGSETGSLVGALVFLPALLTAGTWGVGPGLTWEVAYMHQVL